MINFIKKKIFGFDEDALRANIKAKQELIDEQKAKITRLKANVYSKQGAKEQIPINFKAPVPKDTEDRKAYVSRAAGFYIDILKDRLKQAISEVRSQLGKVDSTVDDKGNSITSYSPQEFDLLLKGTENALWLIDDWGRMMVGEYQEYKRDLSEEEMESVKKKITT